MTEPEDHPGAPAQKDGEMDFTGFTDSQLRDLRSHFDAARFPGNFQRLQEEISRRRDDNRGKRFVVHFTAADGFLGWLEAVFLLRPYYGTGSVTAETSQILIEGWQRTWLGTGQRAETAVPSDRMRNVYGDHEWVSFDVRRRFLWSRHHVMRAENETEASTLTHLLPTFRSKWFEKQATDIRDFYRHLRAPGRKPWVTPLLVLACVGVYLIQAATSGYWLGLPGVTLVKWGAVVGPVTVHGEWWRLVTSLFLHANLLHLVVNMWVLWSAGRLTESLFGNRAFAVIYFVAGLVGGLLSIAWNPAVSTIGASGAIFGILGAFIAYLLHGSTRIPPHVLRPHLIPTLLFTLFSILNGLGQTGIDNAAHFGGLITGLLLGWAFAVPFDRQPNAIGSIQGAAAITVVVFGSAGLLIQITGASSKPSATEQFVASNDWYASGEAKNLLRWQEIANQAAAGNISNDDLGRQFETEIVPFWRDAEPRLRRASSLAPEQTRAFVAAVADFAALRLRWARALIESTKTNDLQAALDLMQKADVAQARLDWFNLRAQYDHEANSLRESGPIAQLENALWLNYRSCVRDPFVTFNAVSSSDMASDGPARRAALGCQAQHLFLTRDFRSLEGALETARRHPNDLIDGRSSYEAMFGGLEDLIYYGGMKEDDVFVRLADWRRVVPGSVEADLAEASAYVAWAYNARGNGYAGTVTAQNQMIFLHRIAIADAALAAMKSRGAGYVRWYAQSINVNLLGNGKEEDRRALFDKGHALYPDDIDLDARLLHALMPRWGGSFEKVARFISEQALENDVANQRALKNGMPQRAMQGEEKYARLYWSYSDLEGENADIFRDVFAKPDVMGLGLAVMMKHYPRSDYIANMAGRLACESNQRLEYIVFHNAMPKRYSASAWSPNFTVKTCDKKFAL